MTPEQEQVLAEIRLCIRIDGEDLLMETLLDNEALRKTVHRLAAECENLHAWVGFLASLVQEEEES